MENKQIIQNTLKDLKISALRRIAKELNIQNSQKLKAEELIRIISNSISIEALNQKIQIQEKSTNKKRIFWGISGTFIIGLITILANLSTITDYSVKDLLLWWSSAKQYEFDLPINQKIPNILILPFNQYGKGAEDIGKLIHLRLNKKKEEDNLSVNFIYCESCAIGKNFNRDSAQYVVEKYRLDMIVFGDQLAESCSPSGKDEVCVNYLTNSNHKFLFVEKNQDLNKNFSPTTFPEILDGKLQGKIDYVILSLSAVLYKNIGEPQKARDNYNYIFDTLGIKNEDIVGEIVFSSLSMQDSSSALRAIEKYRDFKTLPTIEDWLLIYTLKIAVYSRMKDIQNFESTLSESDIVLSISRLPKNNRTITNFRRMGEFIAPYKPDYAMNFIDDALKYSIQLNIQDEIPKCYHELGRIHFHKSSFNQAMIMTTKALELYSKNNLTHIWNIIKARQLIGACHIRLGKNRSGIKEFKRSIRLIEQTKVSREIVLAYSLLSKELFKAKKKSQAIYYSKEALSVAGNLPESNENQNLNIALYSNLGVIYKESGNHKEGLKWLVKSIQEGKKLIPNYREACPLILNTYIPLIETLEELKNYDQSEIYKAEMIKWSNYCNFSN